MTNSPDWPPQGSAINLPNGHRQRGSTGQLFEVKDGMWQRIQERPKRKTVNVRNDLGRSIMLHLHQTVADDGGGRPFQGRVLTQAEDPDVMPQQIQLHAGGNAGIDKEFFEKWREQNPGGTLLKYFTAQDEDQPESA